MHGSKFPRKTDHRGPLERVAMTLSRGDRSVEINVIDPAGELFGFERAGTLRPVRNQVFAHGRLLGAPDPAGQPHAGLEDDEAWRDSPSRS